jgi:hypothetical protein
MKSPVNRVAVMGLYFIIRVSHQQESAQFRGEDERFNNDPLLVVRG